MLHGIHKKTKSVATVWAVLGVLAIPARFIIEVVVDEYGLYIGIISGGGLVLLLMSWFLYGFGQLIENSQQMAEMLALSMQNNGSVPAAVIPVDELPNL